MQNGTTGYVLILTQAEGGSEGGREGGSEGGREGAREGGREGGRSQARNNERDLIHTETATHQFLFVTVRMDGGCHGSSTSHNLIKVTSLKEWFLEGTILISAHQEEYHNTSTYSLTLRYVEGRAHQLLNYLIMQRERT